jgi:hypothetical protein
MCCIDATRTPLLVSGVFTKADKLPLCPGSSPKMMSRGIHDLWGQI